MNWRRGLFRLWIVGAALFVIVVAFLSYSDIMIAALALIITVVAWFLFHELIERSSRFPARKLAHEKNSSMSLLTIWKPAPTATHTSPALAALL